MEDWWELEPYGGKEGRKEGYAVGAVETRRQKGKVYEIHLFFNVPCMYLKIDKFK